MLQTKKVLVTLAAIFLVLVQLVKSNAVPRGVIRCIVLFVIIRLHLATANHVQSENSILVRTSFKQRRSISQNDDSSNNGDSNTVDPDKIIEGGTFNDGSSGGSSNTGDSGGGIDSSKINSGAVFNQ